MQNQGKDVYRNPRRSRAWALALVRYFAFEVDPFWNYLSYFLTLAFVGFISLKCLKFTGKSTAPFENLDIYFISISALTESSLSTIEMENFSTSQLVVLCILMLVGSEVFTSLIILFYRKSKLARLAAASEGGRSHDDGDNDKFSKSPKTNDDVPEHNASSMNNIVNVVNGYKIINGPSSPTTFSSLPESPPPTVIAAVDSRAVSGPGVVIHRHDSLVSVDLHEKNTSIDPNQPRIIRTTTNDLNNPDNLKHESLKCLASIILIYLISIHVIGISLISIYISISPTARTLLISKGLSIPTFSIFLTISTFANCGFLPNNENMAAFQHNSGLQLILIPLILFGNCLYPCCLRLIVWFLDSCNKRDEYSYLLRNYDELGFPHLLSGLKCRMMAATTFAFILLQFILVCVMEWRSEVFSGLNSYEKFFGMLFQLTNSRYSGENLVDLSQLSAAVLVLFAAMMHLPPYYMWYLPKRKEQTVSDTTNPSRKKAQRMRSLILEKYLTFNSLFYLVSFTILICIVERPSFRQDPINFNVFNVLFEVVSGYGNVGYTLGYSCERRIKYDPTCKDYTYGFVGRWSRLGKFILTMVMMYGRMKRFGKLGSQGRRYKSYRS